MHVAVSVVVGFAAIGLIWWEIHRHRRHIVAALFPEPPVDKAAAHRRVGRIEAFATCSLIAALIFFALAQ